MTWRWSSPAAIRRRSPPSAVPSGADAGAAARRAKLRHVLHIWNRRAWAGSLAGYEEVVALRRTFVGNLGLRCDRAQHRVSAERYVQRCEHQVRSWRRVPTLHGNEQRHSFRGDFNEESNDTLYLEFGICPETCAAPVARDGEATDLRRTIAGDRRVLRYDVVHDRAHETGHGPRVGRCQ